MKEIVKEINELCKEYIGFVESAGNECAYTDGIVESIIKKANELKEKYDYVVADIFLEMEELLECDIKTGNIKVDKQIFDGFVPNTHINIKFVDTDSDEVFSYVMVSEDDEGIYMEHLEV